MRVGPRHIPTPFYRKILEVLPVACTDAVIVRRGKFLLGRRVNKPAKGAWWFVGGRVYRGELLQDAMLRHIAAETGMINIKIKKILTARETIFKDSAQGPASHTIATIFLVKAQSPKIIAKIRENSELKWFSKINPYWHPYVKEMLRLAGFK